MNRSYRSLLSFAFCTAFVALGSGTAVAIETMSPSLASRLGLEESWQRQIQLPAGSASIVDQQLFVHKTDPHVFVEVVATLKRKNATTGEEETYESVVRRISISEVDRSGKEIGQAEAERLAGNEIYRLNHRKVDAKVTTRTVPRVNLYTLGDDGTVECRDAESGLPIWMTRVGSRTIGYGMMGIDDQFLTVINGANLIKMDITDGTEISSIPTKAAPSFGAIHAGEYTIVPTISDGIEGYPLADTSKVPFIEIVQGHALAPPRKSATSARLAWATDRGYFYVMECEGTPSVLFRLSTDGIVSGRVASAGNDFFYFGSEAGQVYSVEATREGRVVWSRPYGEPFYNEPMIAGNQILLRSTYGNLYSLDIATGMMTWTYTVPNVDELLGAFDGKVFVRLLTGGLSVIDMSTGKVIQVSNEVVPTYFLANTFTNRLYLISQRGAVQCLRPEGEMLPTFNESKQGSMAAGEAMAASKEEPAGPAGAFAGQDKAKDPFGASADPAAAGDPFGGAAADPFGAAGGGDAMADPFGGADGADPFGGAGDPFN